MSKKSIIISFAILAVLVAAFIFLFPNYKPSFFVNTAPSEIDAKLEKAEEEVISTGDTVSDIEANLQEIDLGNLEQEFVEFDKGLEALQ